MVSRRDLLLGLGAAAVTLAILPGCGRTGPAQLQRPEHTSHDIAAWAQAAVDELVRHGTAAWCNVVRTQYMELVLDVVGESQALATTWQLQLGLTRADNSSEIRTIEIISQQTIEATVAAMIGATTWAYTPPRTMSAAIQAYGALQPVVQLTPQPPWRDALRMLHATLVPMLHSRIIYHSVALQQQVQERWSYHRKPDQTLGQKFAATITRQMWQCTTATRQHDQLDFVYARQGSSKPTPAPGFAETDLQNLLTRALRHATPSDPPRGVVQVLLAPDITASVLIAAQFAELAVPTLQFDPLQAEAYGRTPLSTAGLPAQPSPPIASPAENATTDRLRTLPWRPEFDASEPAHFTIAGGTSDVATLRDQPGAVYLLEAGDVSIHHNGDVIIWPAWALELVHGVTSGRAYRLPIVQTTLAAIAAAPASSDREMVVAPATAVAMLAGASAAISVATATATPTIIWSAKAPWLLLTAEFV